MRILAINPGSTSTKISYYVDGDIKENRNIIHENSELEGFNSAMDQIDFRRDMILKFLEDNKINPKELNVVVGRGGILPPVESGAFEVNADMINYLKNITKVEHPSNLGGILAKEIASKADQALALIYDPVSVDQYEDISRISGLKGIERKSIGHALNMRAVAIKIATDKGLDYEKQTFIVAHLGGGNTISIHHNGRMIDSISDDEGPFSTERTGGLPLKHVISMCYEKTKGEMLRLYKREGGLKSYSGTSDAREVEARINAGDADLKIVYDAFIYQIAKGIVSLSVATNGQVDRIILTGGVVHSKYVVEALKKRVSFLASVEVFPGEHEMIALCKGAERAALGLEKIHQFKL